MQVCFMYYIKEANMDPVLGGLYTPTYLVPPLIRLQGLSKRER